MVLEFRDVTELSQIRIRRMRIQLFNSGRMRIRIYIYSLLNHVIQYSGNTVL